MILLAGINGAGKTTFYYTKIKPFLESQGLAVPFVNADQIEKGMFPNEVGQHSYTAARQATRLRDHCFETSESFVTETVFSHQSKIDLIGQAQEKTGDLTEVSAVVIKRIVALQAHGLRHYYANQSQ